jgi:hypothetical protein
MNYFCALFKINLNINSMKSLIITALLFFSVHTIFAQALPIVENFTFSGNLTANGWVNSPINGGTVPTLPATSTTGITGLTFTGYSQSGIGNAARVVGDGEDVYKPFTAQTSGTVYAGAMINVNAASTGTNGDYFYHFYGQNVAGTNYQFCRFFIKDELGLGFKVSLLKTLASNGAAHSYTTSQTYPYGTTIFVVLKYVFSSAGSADDPCTAYVFTEAGGGIPATEPASPTIGPVTAGATVAGDAGQLLGLSLRRNDPSMNVIVDGITVANTWAQVLPVTLSRFDVRKNGNSALVSWNATLEKDEPKYIIQQSKDGVYFDDIFTQNANNQNTTFDKKYEYELKNLTKGLYYFRLKMTDKTGWSENSATKSVRIDASNISVSSTQNSLTIQYKNESDFVEKNEIYIMDYQGKKVKTLELSEAKQVFNLDDLQTGFYFLNCEKESAISGFKFFKK